MNADERGKLAKVQIQGDDSSIAHAYGAASTAIAVAGHGHLSASKRIGWEAHFQAWPR